MTTASIPSPLSVICPACNAQVGNPCTQPDDRSRHNVKFFHYPRITLVEQKEHAQEQPVAATDDELQELLEATALQNNEKIPEPLEIPAELQPERWRDLQHGLIAHEPCGAVFIPGPTTKPLHEAECQSILRGMSAAQIEEARKRPPLTTRDENEERQIGWAIARHRRGHSSRPGAERSLRQANDLLIALGLKPFNVYSEGYAANEGRSGAMSHGIHWGRDFNDAIARWKSEGGEDAQYLRESTDRWGRTTWSYWGCKLFDNMHDARRSFG